MKQDIGNWVGNEVKTNADMLNNNLRYCEVSFSIHLEVADETIGEVCNKVYSTMIFL